MTIVMILIRHVNDRVIIIIIVDVIHRHHHVITRSDDVVQAVAVIVVVTHAIQIGQNIPTDHVNIHDVNGHRADQVKAVVATNVISIHMNEVIHEVIATNRVVVIESKVETFQTNKPSQKNKNFYTSIKAMK